jgi:small-conductance mechanosensitive channel
MGDTPFLDQVILNNTLGQWASALGIAFAVFFALRLAAVVVIRRLKALTHRTSTDLDDLVIELLQKTKGLFILLVAIWAASLLLGLDPAMEGWLHRILGVGLLVQGGLWGTGVVNYVMGRSRRQQVEEDPSLATAVGILGFVAKGVVWIIFVLLILQNLGVEITALLAGVSVGGIAVALAVQNVLGDLLASLSIILDKPFVIGDFIVVGEFSGTVEHVGLKTTHVRSVNGEQLVFANSDLLGSRIRNYKRMQERRVVFTLGLVYDTPPEKLEEATRIIREVVEAQELARFDRTHFKSFGNFSLDVETVFFMTVPDYPAYMDVQQAINLELFRRFGEAGIEFAFPTQTLHVRKEDG